jgi:hypothetical protein
MHKGQGACAGTQGPDLSDSEMVEERRNVVSSLTGSEFTGRIGGPPVPSQLRDNELIVRGEVIK